MPARMGRPPLPAHEKRRRRVVVHLTDGEYRRMEQLAAEQGGSLSDRVCLLRYSQVGDRSRDQNQHQDQEYRTAARNGGIDN